MRPCVTRFRSFMNGPPRDAKHVEWVRAFIGLLDESRKYNMEHHATGLSWNPKVPGLSSLRLSA